LLPYSLNEQDNKEIVNPDIFLNAALFATHGPIYEASFATDLLKNDCFNIDGTFTKSESLHFDLENVRENEPLFENHSHFSTAESVAAKNDQHSCTEHC
jgi:hypothetical protein